VAHSIDGGATIDGYTGFFLGFIRNHVNGSVTISNNAQTLDEIDIGSTNCPSTRRSRWPPTPRGLP